MAQWLLWPPVAFVILFVVGGMVFAVLKVLGFRSTGPSAGGRKSYACGEDTYNHRVQPDYSTFFAFAFFFTLAHVATLVMTTVPTQTVGTFVLAVTYIIGAVLGLNILLRRR